VYWQRDIARRFADTLAAAAKRGCRVRVLLDAVGARQLSPDLVDEMSATGCDVRWFRPIEDSIPKIGDIDHRTHRQILVCNVEIAFTGGVGIADEWGGNARDETERRDTHLAIRGPAVDPTAVGSSTCSGIRGSAETGAIELWRLMLGLISCAEHRIRIGGESSHASLLDAGIDIRTYDVSMMHAKVITVDGAVATVGSANMNQRSTRFDEEANVVIFDADVVGVLDPADWAERDLMQRAAEKVTDVVSGWL